jgi:tetratricopeptide (TPR) repeat protein
MGQGKDIESLRLLNNAARLDPTNTRAWGRLCEGYQFTKEFDRAIVACKRGIQLRPDDGVSYNSLGLAYMAAKEYVKAADAFETAVSKAPGDSLLSGNYVWALQSSGQYEKAVVAGQRLAKLNANDRSELISTLGSLAATYNKLGQNEKAREILVEMQKMDPSLSVKACELAPAETGSRVVCSR